MDTRLDSLSSCSLNSNGYSEYLVKLVRISRLGDKAASSFLALLRKHQNRHDALIGRKIRGRERERERERERKEIDRQRNRQGRGRERE